MNALRRRAGLRLAAIGAAALAASCLGRSPAVGLYTMSSVSDPLLAGDSDGLAIGVGPIRVPRYLDRPEWVWRSGDAASRLEVDPARAWAGGFAANVSSALAEDLAAAIETARVVVYPTRAAFPLDYRIALDFQALEVVADEDLVLRANWVIRARDAQRGPWSGQSGIRHPVAGRGAEAFVAAHNEALALLAGQIAARIDALEAEARPRASDALGQAETSSGAGADEQPARD